MNISAKRRVELALPAAMLRQAAVSCIGRDPASIEEKKLLELLGVAACEPFDGLNDGEKAKIVLRVERAVDEVFKPYLQHDSVLMKVFLTVLFWLRERLECGELVLVDGSSFDKAVSMLIPALEEAQHADLWAGTERSAQKQAKKLHQHLKSLGYFHTAMREAA